MAEEASGRLTSAKITRQAWEKWTVRQKGWRRSSPQSTFDLPGVLIRILGYCNLIDPVAYPRADDLLCPSAQAGQAAVGDPEESQEEADRHLAKRRKMQR